MSVCFQENMSQTLFCMLNIFYEAWLHCNHFISQERHSVNNDRAYLKTLRNPVKQTFLDRFVMLLNLQFFGTCKMQLLIKICKATEWVNFTANTLVRSESLS